MNLGLLFIETILVYFSILLLYKYFKQDGLYIFIILGCILFNVLLLKSIEILSYESVLGLSINTAIFVIANILVQKNGPEEVKKIIIVVLISSFFSYAILSMGSLLNSSDYNLISNLAYDELFCFNLRLFVANLLSMLMLILINARLYHALRRIKNNILISNIFTMIIICFIESIIFIIIGYIGSSMYEILNLIVIRYILKLFIGLTGTIDIYLINKMKN